MRYIDRLPEPQILIDRKALWLASFLASGKLRPDSNKYAHVSIKQQLNTMSHHKCFYCETKLKGMPKEVDHHIEVSVENSLSFEWLNLFLACDNCNNKIPHDKISINDTLNPCVDDDQTIQQHITFNKELIEPFANSPLGLRTITKYRLSNELLDMRRLKQISLFQDVLLEIRNNQINEGRQNLSINETNIINSFQRVDNPYSLMFKTLIDKYNLSQ